MNDCCCCCCCEKICDWLLSGKPIGFFFLALFVLSAVGDRWGIKIALTGTNIGFSVLGLVLIFQDRLGPFLKRIVKIKWGDKEIELRQEVEKLTEKAAEVSESAAPEVTASVSLVEIGALTGAREFISPTEPTGPLHDLAATNPPLAMLGVGRKIETTLRSILLSNGWATTRPQPFRVLVEAAVRNNVFSNETAAALNNFWTIRNRVAHDASDSSALLSGVFTAGMQLSGLLERLQDKYERHQVALANIELFHDPLLKRKIDNATGVLLQSKREGTTLLRMFPTRKTYSAGEVVSWHFDMTPPHQGAAWFRSPVINEGRIMQAWSSAGHFAGEPIPLGGAA